MMFDIKEAFIQAAIVLVQLTPLMQAYECVMASMESTAMLDFKYVMGGEVLESIYLNIKCSVTFHVAPPPWFTRHMYMGAAYSPPLSPNKKGDR